METSVQQGRPSCSSTYCVIPSISTPLGMSGAMLDFDFDVHLKPFLFGAPMPPHAYKTSAGATIPAVSVRRIDGPSVTGQAFFTYREHFDFIGGKTALGAYHHGNARFVDGGAPQTPVQKRGSDGLRRGHSSQHTSTQSIRSSVARPASPYAAHARAARPCAPIASRQNARWPASKTAWTSPSSHRASWRSESSKAARTRQCHLLVAWRMMSSILSPLASNPEQRHLRRIEVLLMRAPPGHHAPM